MAIFNALIAKSRFMRLLTDLRESRVIHAATRAISA
jgi:hypothetical protein